MRLWEDVYISGHLDVNQTWNRIRILEINTWNYSLLIFKKDAKITQGEKWTLINDAGKTGYLHEEGRNLGASTCHLQKSTQNGLKI